MNNKENAQLNIHWGNNTMFIVRTENPITNSANNIDLAYRPSTILLKLSGDENKEIYTSDLGQILQEKSNGIINDFINYARETGGNMNICYQDEHLKSIMGMIITLQTIGYIIKK